MAILIDPEGNLGDIVSREYAQEYCEANEGWTWQQYHDDEDEDRA